MPSTVGHVRLGITCLCMRASTHHAPSHLPARRRALAEFYAPYNRQLAELLGDPSILKWSPPEI